MRPNDAIIDTVMAAHGQVVRYEHGWFVNLPTGRSGNGYRLRFYYNDHAAIVRAQAVAPNGQPQLDFGRLAFELVDGRLRFVDFGDRGGQHWSIPEAFHAPMLAMARLIMGHGDDDELIQALLVGHVPTHSYQGRVRDLTGVDPGDYATAPNEWLLVRRAIARGVLYWRKQYNIHMSLVDINQPIPADRALLTIDDMTLYLADLSHYACPGIYVYGPLGWWRSTVESWHGPRTATWLREEAVPLERVMAARGSRPVFPQAITS